MGLGLRLSVVAQAPFPINDGGLFHAFINDILQSGLRLPAYSSYNGAGIPLVYPPLGLYFAAILHVVSGISTLAIIQYIPAVVSAACVPAFFALAERVLQSRSQALLATLAFSVIPRSFDWLIMGGGITRSFGLLFTLLFLVQASRVFARGEQRAIFPAIGFGGLVVLSHPEAAVHAALTAMFLVVWHRHVRSALPRAAAVVLGVAALTAPWWISILIRHGTAPWIAGFSAAHQDSYDPLLGLVALLRFDFTDEPLLRLFGVLGLLGFIALLARRRYFLPAWFVLLHFVEPRGGTLFMMIPLAMSGGHFIHDILLPALTPATAEATRVTDKRISAPRLSRFVPLRGGWTGLLIFLFLYGSFAAYTIGLRLREDASLASRDIAAMDWIANNTAADAPFALVTGGEPLLDPTSDWFPAITERRSVASFFGSEWIPGSGFGLSLARYTDLQACATLHSECIKAWASASTGEIDYVYVRARAERTKSPLQGSLGLDPDFRLIYSQRGIELYEWVAGSTK